MKAIPSRGWTIVAVFFLGWSLPAQQFAIPRHRIANGGGTSGADEFTVTGTIGQHEATQFPLTGGSYSVRGGFWSPLAARVRNNHAPTAAPFLMETVVNTSVSAPVFQLVSLGSDPDGDSIDLAGLDAVSGQGGIISLTNDFIIYQPPGLFMGPDSFSYSLRDIWGRTAAGTISVNVAAPTPGYNQLSADLLGGGDVRLSYLGVPGTNYVLDRALSLDPPVTWVPQVTNTAGFNGMLFFTNAPVPGTNNFWRTRYLP